ncbi:flavin monoamine oxidase family protein [Kitasatospora cathayae]|uniref:FAD-dependent oxidoreductase n=1 Tax=Kitasatospora cathayae TaxID=3004092 RepID=A0ABY7Q0N1_9ACTN|nr:FAD-dependent oxidoreductase [Kitasatospora sp. HUAS 3-15]WBP86250.1 FAD-dependent oxidoreductase [Kitasatospora sp. HUAS 3-15]
MTEPTVNRPGAPTAASERPRLARRALLGSVGAAAAAGAIGAGGRASAVPSGALVPAFAPSTGAVADEAVSRALAREMLMVGEDEQSDLTLEYLRILIDGRLPARTGRKRVLVVGAGIAGLTVATLLKQAGHEVVVIEANASRVGGRIKTFRRIFSDPLLHAEAGAMRLPDFHPLVLGLADKLGLKRRLFYNADVQPGSGPSGAVPPVTYRSFTGESWSNGPQGTFTAPAAAFRSLISVNGTTTSRAAYSKSPAAVNRSFGARFDATTAAALNKAFEKVTVPDGDIRSRLDAWTGVFRTYGYHSTRRYLREEAGWDTASVQAVGTLENLTSRLHYSLIPTLIDHAVISPANRYWELEDGTAALTDALAAPLTDELRLGCRMTRLRQEAGKVTIETVAESGDEESCDGAPTPGTEVFEGDYAIVTIPFSALRFCRIEPLMSYPKRRAVAELHYDSATKVLLEFHHRFWEQGPDGFTGGGCVSDSASRFTYLPSHAPQGSPGGVVLASYTWSDDAARWDSLTPGERYAFALDDLERLFGPRARREFTGVGATQSWARARYALGEAAIVTPGQLHELHPATRTPEGRVHFAGEHTSLKPAWIEGALESAVRTFLEVHQR